MVYVYGLSLWFVRSFRPIEEDCPGKVMSYYLYSPPWSGTCQVKKHASVRHRVHMSKDLAVVEGVSQKISYIKTRG